MKSKAITFLGLIVFTFMVIGTVSAFENITAKEAYNMLNNREAILIDVRTLEEVTWVGSPALEAGGDPAAYLIPWKIWVGVDEQGKSIFELNEDFDEIVLQTFELDQKLITMCRSGGRSTAAALLLEDIGFTNVYEIDNILKEGDNGVGGRGGFQGTNYSNAYNGYRGYARRLKKGNSNNKIEVQFCISLQVVTF